MPITITVTGKTTRALITKFKNELISNGHTMKAFSDQIDKRAIGRLAFDLLNIVSNNDPFGLLNSFLTKDQKLNIQPLNKVIYIHIILYIYILYIIINIKYQYQITVMLCMMMDIDLN